MTITSRRKFSAALKAKGALESVRSECSVAELAQQSEVDPSQITDGKRRRLERAGDVFGAAPTSTAPVVSLKVSHTS